jgi:hypothetical protein
MKIYHLATLQWITTKQKSGVFLKFYHRHSIAKVFIDLQLEKVQQQMKKLHNAISLSSLPG